MPKAGILIPVLPDKSKEDFTQQATAYSLPNTTGISERQEKALSDPFSSLNRAVNKKRPLTFYPDQNNIGKSISFSPKYL